MTAHRKLSLETAAVPAAGAFQSRCDLPGTLLPAALVLGLATAIGAATVAFRLGAQLVVWTSPPAPASWLYSLGGAFASPFARCETAHPVEPGTAIEFSGLVALEAYLTAGLVLLLGLIRSRTLARGRAGEAVDAAVRPLLSYETPPARRAASPRRGGRRARPAVPRTRA